MAELKFFLFHIERGLCAFVETPNRYGVMIDCGWSSARRFSPAAWIASERAPSLAKWGDRSLAWLIITHPHEDHVEDIDTVRDRLKPAILKRRKNYEWGPILEPARGSCSDCTLEFYRWQRMYNVPVQMYPDLGCRMMTFSLTPRQAAEINPDTQHLLNNSSIVTVFDWTPPGQQVGWKLVVSGDNETAGWDALLQRDEFREAIRGADFFVSAHHGHNSGFSADVMEEMGKPFLILTSERDADPSVFAYGPYARGTTVNGEQRRHLTTRHDGHIIITMKDNLHFSVETYREP